MKILLVNPLDRLDDAPRHIPFEAAVLANIAHMMGHQTGILDLNALRMLNTPEALRKEFSDAEWKETDVICVVAACTQFNQLGKVLPVARAAQPKAVIMAGGPLLTALPRDVMKLVPELDVAYVGEGENAFKEVLDHVDDRRWERVRGLAYRREGGVLLSLPRRPSSNLDAIPFPKYDLLPLEEAYFPNSPIALSAESFMSRRRMSFSWWRKGARPSPRHCVDNVKQARLRYAIDFATITDRLPDPAWIRRYCEIYVDEGMHETAPWGTQMDVATLASDPSLVRTLREAGCRYAQFDFGSASDAVLKGEGRNYDRKMEQLVLDEMSRNGLGTIATFGVGFSDEGIDDVLETVNFLVTNGLEVDPFIQALYPDSRDFGERRNDVISQQYGGQVRDYLVDLENSYGLAAYASRIFDCGDLLALKALVRAKDTSRLLSLSHKRGWSHGEKWRKHCPVCKPDLVHLPETTHAPMAIAGNPNRRA